jgi:2,4-dienoyl-CoA reductase-like NADH-dependent reductase (Old Yellow Enzyme family)
MQPTDAAPRDPFGPARLGHVNLRNRFLKAATFEGMSPANVVSPELIEFHRKMAAGGVAMTTVSYVAVSRDGRGAPAEIYVHDAAADGLAAIADVVHAEGARICAQLGHAGAVGTIRKRYLGPSPGRTIAGTRVQAVSVAEIDEIAGQFAGGARMLADAGFDAVELHFGHHYLVSAFLSPRWNRRTDDYGGSTENRARLARQILRAVRAEVGTAAALHGGQRLGFRLAGRALLREPDLVARMQAGTATAGTCTHCNKCVPSIYTGTRCVLDHPDPIRVS